MKNEARPSGLSAMIWRARINLAKVAVKILLPPDIWIGNHKGSYTCKWAVHLGKLDSRGVLQGVEERSLEKL
jgi:hypothetical protein